MEGKQTIDNKALAARYCLSEDDLIVAENKLHSMVENVKDAMREINKMIWNNRLLA